VPAHVVHAPALEDLSPVLDAADNRKPPTAEVGKGGEENRGLHTLAGENHSLARASHAFGSWVSGGDATSVDGGRRQRRSRWRGACRA
jgi:hypothetical protein